MTVPRIESSEVGDKSNQWVKELPICDICGKQMLDYVTITSEKGTILSKACTTHHDPAGPDKAIMVAAITAAIEADKG
jgi:hypothetical protein